MGKEKFWIGALIGATITAALMVAYEKKELLKEKGKKVIEKVKEFKKSKSVA